MTINQIKALTGTIANIKKLADLVEQGKLSQVQYWEIRAEWSKKDREYNKTLGGSLSEDIEKVKGESAAEN